MSEEIRRCCATCSYFPGDNEEHELDVACCEYEPLDLDRMDPMIRDSILIKLYGAGYLRNYYDEEEFEDLFGGLEDLEEYSSKTGSTCPADDGPWVVNETPYVDRRGLKVCEFLVDKNGKVL